MSQGADTGRPCAGWMWMPVALFVVLSGIMWMMPNRLAYEPPYLVLVLNAVFLVLVSFLVAALAARTYLSGGSSAYLAMGSGMLAAALSSIYSGITLPAGKIDAGVAVYNIGIALAAVGNLLGAVRMAMPARRRVRRIALPAVLVSYGGTILATALLSYHANDLPMFFVPGQGSTMLRNVVLGVAAGSFAASWAILLIVEQRAPSVFLRWYGVGLLLIAIGMIGVWLAPVIGSALTWTGRASQWTGGIYLLIAVSAGMRGSLTWTMPLELLQETHRRYERLVEQCPDAILVMVEGRWIFANAAAASLFGAAHPRELMGRAVVDFVEGDDREPVRQFITQPEHCPQPTRVHRLNLARVDGRAIRVEATAAAVRHRGRAAIQIVLRDVTDRQRMEQALRESEALARSQLAETETIYNSACIGLCAVDRELRYTRVNQEMAQMNGLDAPRHLGRTVAEVLPQLAPTIEPVLRQVLDSGQPMLNVEIHGVTPAAPQQMRYWLANIYPVRDGEQRVIGVGTAVLEITARKRLEEDLHKAVESAETANKAKDHFLAVLSHELRTPLNPALMTAAIVERDAELPPRLREDLATIRRNIELEARLIEDMLDLTRIARGKLTLNRRVVDACQILRHAVGICHADATDKAVAIAMSLPDVPILVDADPARLQQVFWNLLKNAIKFTPSGGRIGVSAGVDSRGWLWAQVSDTGIGIAPELLGGIFDAFEQGGAHITREFGGLGLGLAICRGLIEMQQGVIYASSGGSGQGATFTIQLPPAPRRIVGTDADGLPVLGSTPAAERGGTCRILLVEDHESTARITARLLRGFGHTVMTAGNIADAIGVSEREAFDLLISDLGLPDGTGHDLLRQLQARQPIRAIALSGYGMDADLRVSAECGFLEHLVKPINVQQLQDAIQRSLGAPASVAAVAGVAGVAEASGR